MPVLPICWVLLFVFANRKSVTVTIQKYDSQIVKGNRVISEEEVEISKANSAIMRFSTDTVEIGENERSLGKNRHEYLRGSKSLNQINWVAVMGHFEPWRF